MSPELLRLCFRLRTNGGGGLLASRKKERLAHRHFWLKDHERSSGETGSVR